MSARVAAAAAVGGGGGGAAGVRGVVSNAKFEAWSGAGSRAGARSDREEAGTFSNESEGPPFSVV